MPIATIEHIAEIMNEGLPRLKSLLANVLEPRSGCCPRLEKSNDGQGYDQIEIRKLEQ